MLLSRNVFQLLPLVAAISLGGCGGGNDAVKAAGSKPNSFPPTSVTPDFSEKTTPGGAGADVSQLKRNEIRVTVEVTDAMADGGIPTRRNLKKISHVNVRAFRINTDIDTIETINTAQRSDPDNGSLIISFPAFTDTPPINLDWVLQAELPDGSLMLAPVADNNRDVKINPFSDFLVRRVISQLTSKQIGDINDCSATLCLAKALWPALADEIQNFELDIPSAFSLQSAVTWLNERPDLVDYTDAMRDILARPQEEVTTTSGTGSTYNTVYFANELNAIPAEDGKKHARLGTRKGIERISQDNVGGKGYIYPGASILEYSGLGLNISSISSDIPINRQTLTQSGAELFRLKNDWEPNTQSAAPGVAVVRDERFLQTSRSSYQSITNKGSAEVIGWAPNPYFLDGLLLGGKATPRALPHAYFQSGKAILLKAKESSGYDRIRTLENLNIASFDISLQSSTKTAPLSLSSLEGKSYNLVSFATKLASGAEPVRVATALKRWNIGSGGVITEPASSTLTQTYISRAANGSISGPSSASGGDSLTIRPIKNLFYDIEPKQYNPYDLGRIEVKSDSIPGTATGAATPAADMLALALDNTRDGRGMQIGLLRSAAAPVFASANYRLQGHTLGLGDNSNSLRHYNGSRLNISANAATLTLKRLQVTHQIAESSVTLPTSLASVPASATGTLSIDTTDHRISISTTVDSQLLQMEGFTTADQSLLVLRVQHGNHLGLLLGLKE